MNETENDQSDSSIGGEEEKIPKLGFFTILCEERVKKALTSLLSFGRTQGLVSGIVSLPSN